MMASLMSSRPRLSGAEEFWLLVLAVGLIRAYPMYTSIRKWDGILPRHRWLLVGSALLGLGVTVLIELVGNVA